MAWTAPRTWVVNELITAALLNTHLRDNLLALKTPQQDTIDLDLGSDIQESPGVTSFGDVDATNLTLNLADFQGGAVLVTFVGVIGLDDTTSKCYFNLATQVDGGGYSDYAGDDGILGVYSNHANQAHNASFSIILTGLSAGDLDIKLRWKQDATTTVATLYAGAGTANADVHPSFSAIEMG